MATSSASSLSSLSSLDIAEHLAHVVQKIKKVVDRQSANRAHLIAESAELALKITATKTDIQNLVQEVPSRGVWTVRPRSSLGCVSILNHFAGVFFVAVPTPVLRLLSRSLCSNFRAE